MPETQGVIREVARALDAEWRPKGGRVFFITVYEEGEARMREILAALDVPANLMTPIDDASEDHGARRGRPVGPP